MIKGTGVDIVDITRIERAVNSSGRFAERVFTTGELEYCLKKKKSCASLAARFAAKEAVAKALGTGFGKIKWTEIEVVNDESGKPEIKLCGEAASTAERLDITGISLSVSHCENYAVAFVVAY